MDDYVRMTVLSRQYSKLWVVEMHAYALAAANLDIKHHISHQLGIVHPSFKGEDWSFLDNFNVNPCNQSYIPIFEVADRLPYGLHFCQVYGSGQTKDQQHEYWFYKHYINKNIMECDGGFIENLPMELWNANSKQKKEIWTVCTVINSINNLMRKIKTISCPNGFSTNKDNGSIHIIDTKKKQ